MDQRTHCLKNAYIAVRHQEETSYGGNQNWLAKRKMAHFGCGLISISDIILYLSKFGKMRTNVAMNKMCKQELVDGESYLKFVNGLHYKGFFVSGIIKGMVGPAIALAFNWWSLWHGNQYSARWCVTSGKMHERIGQMLDEDIPVLFSAGARIPFFWSDEGVQLYRNDNDKKNVDGKPTAIQLATCGTINRHYMTITALVNDEHYGELMKISSWGREYYIKWDDFIRYVRKKSNPIISNILWIRKK